MNRVLIAAISAILVLLGVGFAERVYAIVPVIQNVVPYDVGGSTYLNITVYHYPEDASIPHYVNVIMVTMGVNSTSLTIGVQPLSPANTFNIQYDLGPISGTPTIGVEAHCIVNGWSSEWTGMIPEFPTQTLMLVLVFAATLVALASRKIRPQLHK